MKNFSVDLLMVDEKGGVVEQFVCGQDVSAESSDAVTRALLAQHADRVAKFQSLPGCSRCRPVVEAFLVE